MHTNTYTYKVPVKHYLFRFPAALSGEQLDTRTGLKACTNECDKSSQCAPGLQCFQRQNGEPIPGCNGTAKRTWDFCYDPRELSRDLDLGSAKMTPTECMRVVRRNKLCDNTYFNLAADGKCSCVGPTTNCSDKKYQIKGDGAVYKIITG